MSDYALGTTIYVKFSTAISGVGTSLLGTPAVAAYADGSTTEVTAGITLTVDLDGRTGLNLVTIVATTGNGYVAGTDYALVVTAGTVGGISVVGTVVGEFSVAKASLSVAERTAIADAMLDQTAGVETNRTVRQSLRLMLSGLAGKLAGAATTTNTFRDTNDTKDRIVAVVDADGNRTSVTLDGS